MATFSKSFNNNAKYNLILTVSEITDSTNIANNTTDVNWELKMTSGSSSFSKWTTRSEVIIDGENVHSKNVQQSISANSSLVIASGTKTIKHDDNGKKTISCSATVSTASTETYLPGSASVSGDLTLSTIPRKSDVTCPSFNAGDSTNIVVSKKDGSFLSTIRYVFGSLSGTIATKTAEKVIGWKPNADQFYAQFPNAKQMSGTIYCDTYSGDTLIGTSEATFTCYAKETDCKPDIVLTAIDVNGNTKALTGNENVVVKGMSNVQLTSKITYKKSATAKYYTVSSGDGKSSTSNPTTLESVNSGTFTATVKDSRDYSNSATVEKTVANGLLIDYVKLAITKTEVKRPESTSNKAVLNVSGNYYNSNFSSTTANELILKYRCREQGGGWLGTTVVEEIVVLDEGESFNTTVTITYGQENIPNGIQVNYDSENKMHISRHNLFTGGYDEVAVLTTGQSAVVSAQISYGDTNLPDGYSATYDGDGRMHIVGPHIVYDYTVITPTLNGNTFSFNQEIDGVFDPNKTYEFEFVAEDKLMRFYPKNSTMLFTEKPLWREGIDYVDFMCRLLNNGEQLYKKGDSLIVSDISCKNLFNEQWLSLGRRYGNTTSTKFATQTQDNNTGCLKPIELDKNKKHLIISTNSSYTLNGVYFYNSDGIFISRTFPTPGTVVAIPTDAYYMTFNVQGVTSISDLANYTWQVEYVDSNTSSATEYTPHKSLGYTSGSNEKGSWVKYDDGRMECFLRKTFSTIPIQTAWGTMYESASLNLGDYPISFVDVPYVQITPNGRFLASVITAPSATSYGTFRAVRPTTAEGMDITVSVEAKGRWK